MIFDGYSGFLRCKSHMSACVSRGEKRIHVCMHVRTHTSHASPHFIFKEMKKENKFEKHE